MTTPVTSLTHAEAVQRAAVVVPEDYALHLDLTGLADGQVLRAISTVRFTCPSPGTATFVDGSAQPVAVTLNGSLVDLTAWDGSRIVVSGLAERNVLTVESVQEATDGPAGVRRSVDPSDGQTYVWMTFEPDDARSVFGCFDQPDLKATFAVTVVAPAAWTVCSNMPAASAQSDGANRIWTFVPTPRLSTYLLVVNGGPFHGIRRERDGFDLGIYARASLAPFLDRDEDELFELTAAGLTFFGERFAMRYPERRYDQVFVPGMGGAMENYGCVTWSDSFLYRSEPSAGQRELRAVVLLHEMAHMWFGDIVTMRWWDDLWLNEAFAEWAANWAAVAATGYSDAWASFLVTRKQRGYAADRSSTRHPIRQQAPDVATAAQGFDMITYAKGASVIKQLVALVGEESFLAGLRGYFAANAWGNATLDDLVGAIATASGRDLRQWVSQWLDSAGLSRVTVRVELDGGVYRRVQLEQDSNGERATVLPRHRLDVGVYDLTGGDSATPVLTRRNIVPVEVHDDGVDVSALVGRPAADLLLVNDDDLAFVQVRPDPLSLQTVLDGAGALPSALSRTVAWMQVWDLVASGELAADRLVGCGLGLLPSESVEPVMEALLTVVVQAADLWSADGRRDELLAQVADLCDDLARPDRQGPEGGAALHGRRMTALRGLARTAVTEQHFAVLASAGARDVDLRWRLLERRAAVGVLDEAGITAVLAVDPDPDSWVREFTVRCAYPSADSKDSAWQAAIDGRVPAGALDAVGKAFWQRSQDDLLRGYADRFLAALPTISTSGMLVAMATAIKLFPVAGVHNEFLDRVDSACHENGVSPLVAHAVAERSDELRRMLVARSFDI